MRVCFMTSSSHANCRADLCCSVVENPREINLSITMGLNEQQRGLPISSAEDLLANKHTDFLSPGGFRLSINQSLKVFWIASALHSDLYGVAVDVTEIFGAQFDRSRSDVLFHA